MNRNLIITLVVLLVIFLGGFAVYANKQAQKHQQEVAMQQQKAKQEKQAMEAKKKHDEQVKIQEEALKKANNTVVLAEVNKSGESGTAVLDEQNGKVVVTINVTGYSKDVSQPAHIHTGACPGIGAVKYPLTPVVNGASQTTLSVAMADLMKNLPLAINVHKSASQVNVYTSCGNLKEIATPSASPTP